MRASAGSAGLAFLVLSAAALASVASVELFLQDGVEAYHDWDQHLAYQTIAAASVTQHREAPFWNPYPCGGVPDLAHPESRVYSVFFPLYWVLPAHHAIHLEALIHFFLGALGMMLWTRSRLTQLGELDPVAARVGPLVSASSFVLCSSLALHLAEGHFWILTVAFIPWVVWLIEAQARPLLAGALVAVMIGEGGIYPVPLLLMLLGALTLWRAVERRSAGPLGELLALLVSAVLLSAPKLFPMLELLSRRPRHIDSPEVLTLQQISIALFSRDQSVGRPYNWLYWPWHEQGHYLGWPLFALGLWAVLIYRRGTFRTALVAIGFGTLAFGAAAPWAPWALLHELPLLRSLHVPSRFLLVVVFLVAELGGLGAAALVKRVGRPGLRAAFGVALFFFLFTDALSVRAGILWGPRAPQQPWPGDGPRGLPLVTLRNAPAAAYYSYATPSVLSMSSAHGVRVLKAYEPLCPRAGGTIGREPGLSGRDEPDYRGEAWVEHGSARAVIQEETHNTISLYVSGKARVLLTQNFDPGWRAKGGTVVDDAGRLAVEVEREGAVRLYYRPPYLDLGVLAFLGGLALLGWAGLRSGGSKSRAEGAGSSAA